MELEPVTTPFVRPEDCRPRIIPPPPVQLVAIADVMLPGVAGLEREFDAFYVGLLRLERQCESSPSPGTPGEGGGGGLISRNGASAPTLTLPRSTRGGDDKDVGSAKARMRSDGNVLVYKAENFSLRLVIHEVPPPRLDFRPLGMVVPSLDELAQRLGEAQVAYVRQRGLFAGCEYLILSDPAGNLIEVAGSRRLI
jgi:hypothetical protein